MASLLKFENHYINLDFVSDFLISDSGEKETLMLTIVGVNDGAGNSYNISVPIGSLPELRAIIFGWLEKNRIDAGVS